MNSLNDDDLNKINKLKQKLYARTLTDNVSKLNTLHKHDIQVSKGWGDDTKSIEDTGLKKVIDEKKQTESISDFLNNKFSVEKVSNTESIKRADRINEKIDQTTATLKIAQAELNSKNRNSLYPNLKEKTNEFQNDYHPDIKKINIGENADMQDGKKIKPKKNNLTLGFIVFMFIFFFFVGASFYTYVNLTQGTNTISTNKIDIKVTGPVSVKSGEVSEFIVDITNNNTSELILSDLVIQYPKGSRSSVNKEQDLTFERIEVGTIKPGQTIRQKNSVVFFGEQNVKKNIKYSYEFNINDSSTVFKTEKEIGVIISGSPVSLSVDNVEEISNNQELSFNINLSSNTEEILKNIQLRVEYPFGYRLTESLPKPISDNNTWSFSNVSPLASTTIKLKGKFTGEVNVDKNFRFILGIEDPNTKEMLTVLSTQDSQVSIRKPFVTSSLLIDGDSRDNKPVTYDQNFKSDLIITNNLSEPITDVVVEVMIGGVLVDRRSINSTDGFYDSNRDVLFWDKSLNANLTKLAPGESRELSFNIRTIKSSDSLIKTLRRSVSDITVNVKAQRLSENRVPENVSVSTKRQLRLQTDSVFVSNLSYVKGVYAPEIGKESSFRYTGSISNTANTLKDVVFTAKLPPNSSWKNVYSSSIPANSIKYNQSTRVITISLGDVEAGSGIDKKTKEFYFDIGFIPTLTQKGQYPVTIISPSVTGTDSFTGIKLNLDNNSMTTKLTQGEYANTDGGVK